MDQTAAQSSQDQLLQSTCQAIITQIAKTLDAETAGGVRDVRMPDGAVIGRQMVIDATEKGGLLNMCRLTIFNVDIAPGAEAARLEYEHDKEGKFGLRRVYSIQSVRRKAGELILLENFLAEKPEQVREEDFRPISSEAYAQQTVLKTVQDWAKYRAWQLQELRKAR